MLICEQAWAFKIVATPALIVMIKYLQRTQQIKLQAAVYADSVMFRSSHDVCSW